MSSTLAPQMHDADLPEGCGTQPGGTRSVLTWGIQSHGPLIFIILGGELDIATAPGLARRLAPLADTGRHLLLDLAGLQFCDCAGLSVFLRLRRRVISAGGSLHLTAPTAAIRRLIVLPRLPDLLPVAAGLSEVITMLSRDDATAPPRQSLHDIDIKHTRADAAQAVGAAS